MKAYVLVRVEAGKESQVLDELIKIINVRKASLVFGPYDIIAEIETATHDELERIVAGGVRRITGVRDTLTLVVAEERTR